MASMEANIAVSARLARSDFAVKEHLRCATEVLTVHDGDIYAMDAMVGAVLNRSICLLRGFAALVKPNDSSGSPSIA